MSDPMTHTGQCLCGAVTFEVTDLPMAEEIFVDRRIAWLPKWPNAGQSTEAQEFAKLQDYLKGEAK